MLFGTHHTLSRIGDIQVKIGDTTIARVDKAKYLGVILDPTLTFNRHVDYLISKMIGRLKMLSRTRPIVTTETSLMLYKTLYVPILDYCDIVYDVLSQCDTCRLQKMQNSALRIIGKADRHASISALAGYSGN